MSWERKIREFAHPKDSKFLICKLFNSQFSFTTAYAVGTDEESYIICQNEQAEKMVFTSPLSEEDAIEYHHDPIGREPVYWYQGKQVGVFARTLPVISEADWEEATDALGTVFTLGDLQSYLQEMIYENIYNYQHQRELEIYQCQKEIERYFPEVKNKIAKLAGLAIPLVIIRDKKLSLMGRDSRHSDIIVGYIAALVLDKNGKPRPRTCRADARFSSLNRTFGTVVEKTIRKVAYNMLCNEEILPRIPISDFEYRRGGWGDLEKWILHKYPSLQKSSQPTPYKRIFRKGGYLEQLADFWVNKFLLLKAARKSLIKTLPHGKILNWLKTEGMKLTSWDENLHKKEYKMVA